MTWRRAAATVALALSLAAAPGLPALAKEAPASPRTETLVEVYRLLTERHYSRPDADRILQGAIQGMLDVVNDPYTRYMTPAEYAEFMEAIQQRYAGIGITLDTAGAPLTILEVHPQSPAHAAGLQPGDVILAVDGVRVDATNAATMPEKIRGAAGTPVTLLIQRGDAAPTAVTIARAQIQLPLTSTADLGNGLRYLRIHSFGATTAQEALQAVADAEKAGARGLVIDLRGNGGGSVLAALQIADGLLGEGTLLVVHDAKGKPQRLTADAAASQIPVAVLIDQHSASASEILAGTLQKNGRARLVGARSFGKGTMQLAQELPNGGVLNLSTDRWELADGTSPDGVGLTPDLPIETPDLVIHAATSLLYPEGAAITYNRANGSVTVGGHPVVRHPQPVEREGRLYLPLRFTLEAMGHAVSWNGAEQAASFTVGGQLISLDLQAGTLHSGGLPLGQPGDLFVADGRTYLSVTLLDSLAGIAVQTTDESVTVRPGD